MNKQKSKRQINIQTSTQVDKLSDGKTDIQSTLKLTDRLKDNQTDRCKKRKIN